MTNPEHAAEHTHITCSHCNYDLTGLDLQGQCPECGKSIIANCFRCDYDLSGIDPAGVCPECGFSIEGSIGRGLLAKADPEYLAKLHKGVFVIQAAIILYILALFVIFGLSMSAGLNGGSTTVLNIAGPLVGLIFSAALIYGWWLFSTENPDYTGEYSGSDARKLIRIMIFIAAGFALIQTAFAFAPQNNTILIVAGVLGLIALGVSVVRFFAEMFYIKWMAPLIRDKRVYKRSKTLMWLGPVLMTFGLLLIGLGPLIALILYWNMLDWIRKDLKAIRHHNRGIV